MAKSLEDTLFYRWAPLLALNEVGGDPAEFGCSLEHFHAENGARAREWPDAMIATATHDTKRGEDARARLLALSEMPDEWEEMLGRWRELVRDLVTSGEEEAPDANDQVILLQTVLGAWPPELLHSPQDEERVGLQTFQSRLHGYVEKALREAKRHSSWVNVDEAYEGAAKRLVSAILQPGSAFLDAFRPFARRLAEAGMRNGLARTVLKATLPGVPDIYQGTEDWDLSLVDPDNRRPVDYGARSAALDEAIGPAGLVMDGSDGRLKQAILARLLGDRAAAPALYATGDYRPLRGSGPGAARIVAFARKAGGEELVTAIVRFSLDGEPDAATRVAVPPGDWREVLSGRTIPPTQEGVAARELFRTLPVAVLRRTA
jgi:(1->4)-alpha-D-glucan 1-alpha-D-glucosylmutase